MRLAHACETLVVGEGIESTVSVQQAIALPAWAALSASGIVALRLPDRPSAHEVITAPDNDEFDLDVVEKAAARWDARDLTVRIAMPPVTGWDFNKLPTAPDPVALLPERRHG